MINKPVFSYFDDKAIDHLKYHLDPMDIIEGLGLDYSHESGNWLMCHCPFTNNHSNGDQNASFGLNKDSLNYNCFVCGGGSLISLVMWQLGKSHAEAVSWLNEMSSLEPQVAEKLVDKVNKIIYSPIKESVMPIYDPIMYEEKHQKIYMHSLAKKYLEHRGISGKIAEMHGIGFDNFHYGITIPHFFDGHLRGWQIRHLLEEKNKFYCDACGHNKTVPKYTNTPNFPKLNTLFLYDEVIGKDVTVVESPLSALYLWSLGVTNAVATFGSFSLEQAELLKKFSKVRIWPDNDTAGEKNLFRVLDELSKSTDVVIVPVVDKHKGDAADVLPENMYTYLFSAYPPTILPLFKDGLPTLDQVKTVL